MVQALGFSENAFDPRKPGRLCRGRERWIERWEPEESDPDTPIIRTVITGAQFTDDSASDAKRGLKWSGVELASVLASLFPRKTLLAFMEDGHPADIPEKAVGIEAYEAHRAGGRTSEGLVRWHMRLLGVGELRGLFGEAPPWERARGLALVDDTTDDDQLIDTLFSLVGFSTLDSPPAQYQPLALHQVLEVTKAVVLIHRDKAGVAVGVYSREPIPKLKEKLTTLTQRVGTLLVPFAIPPMLARWDRALSELRAEWMNDHEEEFPVPVAPEQASWERRRRGRRRERSKEPAATEEPAQVRRLDASLDTLLIAEPKAEAPAEE